MPISYTKWTLQIINGLCSQIKYAQLSFFTIVLRHYSPIWEYYCCLLCHSKYSKYKLNKNHSSFISKLKSIREKQLNHVAPFITLQKRNSANSISKVILRITLLPTEPYWPGRENISLKVNICMIYTNLDRLRFSWVTNF